MANGECSRDGFYLTLPAGIAALPEAGTGTFISAKSWVRSGVGHGQKVKLEDWSLMVPDPKTGQEVNVKSRKQLKKLVGHKEVHARVVPAGTKPNSGAVTFASIADVSANNPNLTASQRAQLVSNNVVSMDVLQATTKSYGRPKHGRRLEVKITDNAADKLGRNDPAVLVKVVYKAKSDYGSRAGPIRQQVVGCAFVAGPNNVYANRQAFQRKLEAEELLHKRWHTTQKFVDHSVTAVQALTLAASLGVGGPGPVGAVMAKLKVLDALKSPFVPNTVSGPLDAFNIYRRLMNTDHTPKGITGSLYDFDVQHRLKNLDLLDPISSDEVINRTRSTVTAPLLGTEPFMPIKSISIVAPAYKNTAEAEEAVRKLAAAHNLSERRIEGAVDRLRSGDSIGSSKDWADKSVQAAACTTEAVIAAVAAVMPAKKDEGGNGQSVRSKKRKQYTKKVDAAVKAAALTGDRSVLGTNMQARAEFNNKGRSTKRRHREYLPPPG